MDLTAPRVYAAPPMFPGALSALALASTAGFALGALSGVLGGIWLGFKISTRDAALLARFAVDSREARATAERIEESVEATLESVERKRASAAAAASRADAKLRAVEEAPPEAPPEEELSPRERRRNLGRRLRGVA